MELPRYRSHKVVQAGEIVSVELPVLVVDAGDGARVNIYCDEAMFARYTPVVGDYYVVYQPDGYASISPRAKFEEGYTRI